MIERDAKKRGRIEIRVENTFQGVYFGLANAHLLGVARTRS